MHTQSQCESIASAVERLGISIVQNDNKSIWEAFQAAECCRRSGRFELARTIIAAIESQEISIGDTIRSATQRHSTKIDARDYSAIDDWLISQTAPNLPQLFTPSGDIPEPPPIWIRGLNYSKAMARWVSAGFPMCTQEQIESRLAICQGCLLLVNDICTHEKCGCNCSDKNHALNKLAIATERCPEGKWVAVN